MIAVLSDTPAVPPPDLSGLRALAARLEQHAHTLESCAQQLHAEFATVAWRSMAGDLARERFELELTTMRSDIAGLREAGAAVRAHVTGVEDGLRTVTGVLGDVRRAVTVPAGGYGSVVGDPRA